MIVARTSNGRYRVWCFSLLAMTGVACGGGSSTSGTGGGPGSAGAGGGNAGTNGSAGTTGEAGTSGSAGNVGSSGTAGAGGGGNVGSVGLAGSAGGGSAGMDGSSAGRGGATGAGGRGGSTSTAGATGNAGNAGGGRGGTTGSAGSAGTAGGPGAAMPSAGCGTATASPMSGHFTIDAAGTAREYIIKIPTGYDRNHPYRLIVAFHGRMYDAASVDAGGAPCRAAPTTASSRFRGVVPSSSPAQALDQLDERATTSPTSTPCRTNSNRSSVSTSAAIFATGFSMGAIMTIPIGCSRPTYRAIAAMSGSLNGGTCAARADRLLGIARHQRPDDPHLDGRRCATRSACATTARPRRSRAPSGLRQLHGLRRRLSRQLVRVRRRSPAPALLGLRDLGLSVSVLKG